MKMAETFSSARQESKRKTEETDLAHLSKRVKSSAQSEASKFDYGEMEPLRTPKGKVSETFSPACGKVKDHDKFIPIRKFTKENLPAGYQSDEIFRAVTALADLTVKVRCTYTSTHRPEIYQVSGKEYPFYRDRGKKNFIRCGTGRVWHVQFIKNGPMCSCRQCKGTKTVKGKITVLTATHVVFNTSEARSTCVDFFFDDQESRSSCTTLDGAEVYVADEVSDRCYFDCYTCDEDLVLGLIETWKEWLDVCKVIRDEHKNPAYENKLAIMVAHPHGMPKQVSLGRWLETKDSFDAVHFYTYDCPTCPGSSGAYVLTLARQGWWSNHVHSGANHSINYSGSGIDWGWCVVNGST